MSSAWGDYIKISIFGESHGEGIGVVLDNLPAGEAIDMDAVLRQMARRAPGRDRSSTPRKEADTPRILSGFLDGKTTGAPLCAVIENTNTRSADYKNIELLPRPGHSDYPGFVRYGGFNDVRGGGHFSGRLTAPLTFAGAVCRQILLRRGIHIGGHVAAIAGVKDTPFDMVNVSAAQLDALSEIYFPLNDREKETEMREKIEAARLSLDSVGGIAEIAAVGVPAGIGSPMFYGVENVLSSIMYGVPAVKGPEFGIGFGAADLRGSQDNDPYEMVDGEIRTKTNNCGGVLGGITTGMPIVVRAVVKPTSSIAQEQDTVDLTKRVNAKLSVHGRHDPCIVPRAVPVLESAMAIGLINLLAERGKL